MRGSYKDKTNGCLQFVHSSRGCEKMKEESKTVFQSIRKKMEEIGTSSKRKGFRRTLWWATLEDNL